jgi:hypothetical protein
MARDLKTPLSESSFDKSKGGPKLKSYTTSTGRKVCYLESKGGSMREAPCKENKNTTTTSPNKKLKRAPKAPLTEGPAK